MTQNIKKLKDINVKTGDWLLLDDSEHTGFEGSFHWECSECGYSTLDSPNTDKDREKWTVICPRCNAILIKLDCYCPYSGAYCDEIDYSECDECIFKNDFFVKKYKEEIEKSEKK